MTSKSWSTKNTLQLRVSSRKLGHHTDPIINTVENCRFKRRSEESLERVRKRSRTSSSPWEGCSYTWSQPQSSSALTYAGLHESTGLTSSSSGERKRKSEEGTQESRKRSRKTPSPSEGPSHYTATRAYSTSKPGTSSSVHTAPPGSRAAFEAKYEEQTKIGEGGFGSVYKGYRKYDNMPVAIKHIPLSEARRTAMYTDTGIKMVPVEVALMLKLKPAEGETSGTVTLLDWYDLDNELILVLERPVPCLDMIDYLDNRGSSLPEHEAKIMVKQLVDALTEVHSEGVFHRDIKLENILIETGSDVPRVRLIDFGCGTFLREGEYTEKQGTFEYFSPEYFQHGWYKAEPTTVWQLGVVVFAMLHDDVPFNSSAEIISGNPVINESLSFECQRFILSCLVKNMEARPTLETLKHHPWLM